MAKMKYGIDLGTTNSAVSKMEHGEPKIIKTTEQKDIMPSCVAFSKNGKILVGEKAITQLNNDRSLAIKKGKIEQNVFVEFKRTMGLDTIYHSDKMASKGEKADYNSEELSAEVLKELKTLASNASDNESINSVVITIPARFNAQQCEATKRAAKLAGFQNCYLLQEPVAAATAYAFVTGCKNGYWLVFDFGGGTFDAALLDVRDGVMTVVETSGNAYLGGKNLDYAIVDEILLPKLRQKYAIDELLADNNRKQILREALKPNSEASKNDLSFHPIWNIVDEYANLGEDDNGEEIEMDLSVTHEELVPVFTPYFQKAVDICKDLLSRHNLSGNQLDKLILVGGPTHSPIVREMLKEQITPNIDTSVDPMTAVAKGASIYAAIIDEPKTIEIENKELNNNVIQLDLNYNTGAVKEKAPVSIMLSDKNETRKLYVQLRRSDGSWSSEKTEISKGVVISCALDLSKKTNPFDIIITDDRGNTYKSTPNEVTFIVDFKPPTETLAFHIGIEVLDSEKERMVFVPINGLEKNQPIGKNGVEGNRGGLHITRDLLPGDTESRVIIPVYEGDNGTEGTSAIYNKHVYDVVISGDDVPQLIPKDSGINVKIIVAQNKDKRLVASFPKYNIVVEKPIEIGTSSNSVEKLKKFYDDAESRLKSFQKSPAIPQNEISDASQKLADIKRRFDVESQEDSAKEGLMEDLREVYRQLEMVEKRHEWDTIEAELRHEFDRLEEANNDLGNKHDQEVNELRRQTDAVIRSRDVKMGRRVLKEIQETYVHVNFLNILMGCIWHYDENFGRYAWRNASQARQLLNQGKSMIASGNINERQLHGICVEVLELLPEDERGAGGGIGM